MAAKNGNAKADEFAVFGKSGMVVSIAPFDLTIVEPYMEQIFEEETREIQIKKEDGSAAVLRVAHFPITQEFVYVALDQPRGVFEENAGIYFKKNESALMKAQFFYDPADFEQ